MKKDERKLEELKNKVLEKKEQLTEQLQEIDYIEELLEDMNYYLIKEKDENGDYILDENGEKIRREPKNVNGETYNYREYFKRYNCIMILLEALSK